MRLAGISWSLVRVWPGATRTVERGLHDRGGASRLCPYCCSATRRVRLPGGGYLEPATLRPSTTRCTVQGCTTPPTRLRPYGNHRRGLCELHACAYAARQHDAAPFTTASP